MRAGDFRHRVRFEVRSADQGSMGGQSVKWVPLVTVWAQIQPLTGREIFAAQAVQSEVTHQCTVRYQAEFASPKAVAAMRMVYAGRIFNIQASMIVDERNRFVQILASEGLDNG